MQLARAVRITTSITTLASIAEVTHFRLGKTIRRDKLIARVREFTVSIGAVRTFAELGFVQVRPLTHVLRGMREFALSSTEARPVERFKTEGSLVELSLELQVDGIHLRDAEARLRHITRLGFDVRE